MQNRIDAIVLAGTQGCRPLEINGQKEYKQFLRIGGRTLLEYSIEAALNCPEISRVYVVSDIPQIEKELPKSLIYHNKLNLTPDRGSYVRNIRDVFLEEALENAGHPPYDRKEEKLYTEAFTPDAYRKIYLETDPAAAQHKILLLYSDTPFIKPEDITRFLATSDDADIVIGFTDTQAVEQLEADINFNISSPLLKTALVPLEDTDVRFSNLSTIKPLKIPVLICNLVQDIYERRYLFDEKGESNTGNWEGITRKAWDYAIKSGSTATVLLGFVKIVRCFSALYAANRGMILPRLLLDRTDFEHAIHLLSGKQMTVSANVGDVAHPMIDVDNEKMYNLLKLSGEEIFERIMSSPRRYRNGIPAMSPQMELEYLEMKSPHLFQGEPEHTIVQNIYKYTATVSPE